MTVFSPCNMCEMALITAACTLSRNALQILLCADTDTEMLPCEDGFMPADTVLCARITYTHLICMSAVMVLGKPRHTNV